MIVVIKNLRGDKYDYMESISCILKVNTTKNEIELTKEHIDFQMKLMLDHGISVPMGQPHVKPEKKSGKRKLHREIIHQNSFENWLKSNYECENLGKFVEIFSI